MSIDSIDTLLEILRRLQLLGPEQIAQIERELLPHYSDPVELGQYLVEIDWLTAYQLHLLLSGRWDDLAVGPYQILERLGEGGHSHVLKAWDTLRGRVVALKVLRQHLDGHSDLVRQFQAELQAVTRLSHPNIIKTYDAQQDGAISYLAMELVEGMDLERFVREVGPLAVDQACDYIRQAAQGLQHAHQMGLVHRDVKPANLFLLHPPLPPPPGHPARRGGEPVVKVIDWGLARCATEQNPTAGAVPSSTGLDVEKGQLIGTADYIAPEQAHDPTLVDIRADIYSLGCTLYYLLAGQPPFHGCSLMQKLLQHQEAEPPSLQHLRPDVPPELEGLIQRMMAKKPEDRFPIPLMVVTPLRRFTATLGRGNGAPNGNGRPGSAAVLGRNGAPGTALNLPRPATQSNLQRPGTQVNLPHVNGQPGSSGVLPRPGINGNGRSPHRG
jgi:serine/threonine protein kinase